MRGGPISSGRSVSPWRTFRRFFTRPRNDGYTIIEVLIVLAVTAGLFVAAAMTIAGRQNRTAFEQSIRGMQSKIQGLIDEVVVGHYPGNDNIQCTATPTGPVVAPGASPQGTNGGCIFVGKVIQFGVAGTNPEQYRVYTMAGLRVDPTTGQEVRTRSEARPILVTDTATPGILENGLTTLSIVANNPTTSGGIAIWQSLASVSGGVLTSSSQANHIGAVPNTSLNSPIATFVSGASLTTGDLDHVDGVRICFVSGSTNQSGLMTLGGKNRRLTVTLDIKSSKDCT
jgi:prepilin-type N-terminal cleavage/methylation domain-containing protein